MLLVQAQQLGRAGLAASLSVAELASGYNTLPNRLRWMLKETMGADGEFERRRAELESEDVLLHVLLASQPALGRGRIRLCSAVDPPVGVLT